MTPEARLSAPVRSRRHLEGAGCGEEEDNQQDNARPITPQDHQDRGEEEGPHQQTGSPIDHEAADREASGREEVREASDQEAADREASGQEEVREAADCQESLGCTHPQEIIGPERVRQ